MKYIVGEKIDDKIYLGVCDEHHVFMEDRDLPEYTWTWLSNYNCLHDLPTRNELDLLINCIRKCELTDYMYSFKNIFYWSSTTSSYIDEAFTFALCYMEIQCMNKNTQLGVRRFYRIPMIKKPSVTMKRVSMRRMK